MDPTQEEEDRRARAEALARMAAIESLGAQTHDALSPVTGDELLAAPHGPRRIELPPDPTLDRIVAGSDSDPIPESPIPDTGTEDVIAPATALGTRDERHGMPVRPQGGLESEQERWERLGTGGGFRVAPAGVSDDAPDAIASGAPVTPVATASDPASGKPERDAARDAAAGPLPRLDAGLPTDEEIGRAHTSDDWRRPLYALASGLMALGGHSAPAFERHADALETERRAGIRAALERKGVLRGQDRTAEAAQQRQDQQDELAQQRLALEERRTAATEAQIPSRVAATEALASQRTASAEDTRADVLYRTATREQRQDPDSAASVGERAALEARLGLMGARGEAERARIPDPATLNADQLHEIRSALTSGVGIRGMGGGSGTASAASAEPSGDSSLAAQYVRHGVAGATDLAEAQAMIDAMGGNESTRAQAVLQSRINEESAATPGPSVQANVAAVETSLGSLQSAIRRYGDDIPGIGLVDGSIPTLMLPQEGREIRAMVRDLADNYLRMVSGAAVPEHEIQNLTERLGTYDERQFRAAIGRMQHELDARRSGSTTGRRPASSATPSSAPEPSSGGGTVRMRRPDGTIAPNVPADRVDAAVARGWERL